MPYPRTIIQEEEAAVKVDAKSEKVQPSKERLNAGGQEKPYHSNLQVVSTLANECEILTAQNTELRQQISQQKFFVQSKSLHQTLLDCQYPPPSRQDLPQ